MTERTILVTGSGGFVGSRVVEAIHLTGFGRPRAGIRRWASASRLARFPTDFVLCDISDPRQMAQAVAECDIVVHCAYSNTRDSIVEGTRTVLQASLDEGVDRFIYLSSTEVYGPDASGLIDESYVCKPSGKAYGDAKLEAERLVSDFADRGLATTIFRPSIIYGPFSSTWTIDIANRLQTGNWGRFEELGDGVCNLVYIDDLVGAIFASLDSEAAKGEIFNVVGPERPTWNEYFERFNDALGQAPLPVISPARASRSSTVRDVVGAGVGKVVDRFRDPLLRVYLRDGPASDIMKRVRSRLRSTPTKSELQSLYSRTADYSIKKAQDLLDYSPNVDLRTGLQLSCQWLEFHGYLNS